MSSTVTFIHGLSNKPEASYLHELWKRKLAHEGFSLDDNGVLSSMVYWADVLYPSPDTDLAAYESAAAGDEALNDARMAVTLATEKLPPDEQKFIEQLSAELAITAEDLDPATLSPEERRQIGYERIPLPAWLRNRLMAKLVRDAHLYFFNKEFSPRSDANFRVRDELRKRFVDALKAVKSSDRPGGCRIAQHGHSHRLRLPDARARVSEHRRPRHHRQPARPRRGAGLLSEVDARERLPDGAIEGSLGQRVRSARRRGGRRSRPSPTTIARTAARSSRTSRSPTGASGGTASASTCKARSCALAWRRCSRRIGREPDRRPGDRDPGRDGQVCEG